jgi:hypothetical protein
VRSVSAGQSGSRCVPPLRFGTSHGQITHRSTGWPRCGCRRLRGCGDDVDADLADGQYNFATALSDFSGGDFVPGLTSLFQGVDDDFLAAPDNLVIGTVEALAGEPLGGPLPYDLGVPVNFAEQLTYAEQTFSGAVVSLFDVLTGADFASIAPLEDLILGVAASL